MVVRDRPVAGVGARPGPRRACISGYGVLSPLGGDVSTFWQSLVTGRSALAPIRAFDTSGMSVTVAAEVVDFDPTRHLSHDEIRRLERVHQFALYAARAALEHADLALGRVDPTRVGVILCTSLGAMTVGEQYQAWRAGQVAEFDVWRLLAFPYSAVASQLARELAVRGPVLSPSIACASGTHAVGLAQTLIARGDADVFVVGGVESLCAFVVNGFNCLRATTTDAVRPFDARRSGLVLGEGAAMLVVEELEHARGRGAATDIEVAGSGLSSDATHMTAPARDGSGALRAMQSALAAAGLEAAAVDFISAHGTGTVYNDAMEMVAIERVLGARVAAVPVNSIKAAIGHTLAAAGAFEAILCAEVLRRGWIPPTLNCEQLDPDCALDIVRDTARAHPVQVAMSTSSAFAGNNAAVVLRRLSAAGDARVRAAVVPESHDVVITGIGLVAPLVAAWQELPVRLARGDTAIAALPAIPGAYGALVDEIPLADVPAELRSRLGRLDRFCRLLLAAAFRALDSAQLPAAAVAGERCGLSVGTGLGCLLTNAEFNQKLIEQGPSAASPRLFAYTVSSAAAGELSIALALKGPNQTIHQGVAAGLGAVAWAAEQIRQGQADLMLAAGVDALGEPLLQALADLRLLKPVAGAEPFQDSVAGLYPSEGAGVLVLESRRHAERRGARALVRVLGDASGFEPTVTRPARRATACATTLHAALSASGAAAAQVACVVSSAHATALDALEREAIEATVGTQVPVLAPKRMWGECFAAHGVLSAALATAWLQSARAATPARRDLLALLHSLCYSGPTVSLVLAQAE